jgi:chromosome segregation ATPase
LSEERKALTKKLDAHKKHLAEAQEALRRSQAETAAKGKEASAAVDKSKQLAARLIALAAEGDALRKANEQLSIEVDKTYSSGNKTLKRHIAASETARNELLTELNAAKQTTDELTQQYQQLKGEHQRLTETLAEANAHAKKQKRQLSNSKEAAAGALKRVGDLEEEQARLVEALDAASTSTNSLKSLLDAANEQKKRLTEELASIKEAATAASKQHQSVADERARLAQELAATSAQVQALTLHLEEADAQRNRLLEEVAATKTASEQTQDRCKEIDGERTRLADALRVATAQAETLTNRLEAAQVQIRELADKLAASREESTQALKRCDGIDQERSRLAAALAAETATADTLKAQIEALQSQPVQTEASATTSVAAIKAQGVGQIWNKLKQLGSDGEVTRSSLGSKRNGKDKRL